MNVAQVLKILEDESTHASSFINVKNKLTTDELNDVLLTINSAFVEPIELEIDSLSQSLENLKFVFQQTENQLDEFNRQRFKIALNTAVVSTICLKSVLGHKIPSGDDLTGGKGCIPWMKRGQNGD